ncbi:MAG: hypothetical protein JW801_08290 [Bacteroidales bacterium]|nr:hypothetical protein [Bacteroidales bacterium]
MKTRTLVFLLLTIPLLTFASDPGHKKATSALSSDASSIEYVLENWMFEPATWSAAGKTMETETEESEVVLESWMIQPTDKSWSNQLTEQEVELESWMNDPSGWKTN